MEIKIGSVVEITDTSFVKSNGENVGIIVKGMWFVNDKPELYGGITKMFIYEVKLRQSGRSVLLPLESLKVSRLMLDNPFNPDRLNEEDYLFGFIQDNDLLNCMPDYIIQAIRDKMQRPEIEIPTNFYSVSDLIFFMEVYGV